MKKQLRFLDGLHLTLLKSIPVNVSGWQPLCAQVRAGLVVTPPPPNLSE